jgi:hypothetical protein
MTLAPAEYMIFGFPGNQFNGKVAPALADLVDKGLIRLRDLLFISKDADGNVTAFEIDEVDELKPFLDVKGEAGGLLTEADVEHAADALQPNSSAALLIWEDLWAAEFAEAVRDSGGVVLEGARIPHWLWQAALAQADD